MLCEPLQQQQSVQYGTSTV